MSNAGQKIIEGLKQALVGNFARVTVEGQTWVRKEELDRLRAENAELRELLEEMLRVPDTQPIYAWTGAVKIWLADHPAAEGQEMTCTTMMIAGAQAEAKSLREECDRLRAELDGMQEVAQAHLDTAESLRAENAELREWLEQALDDMQTGYSVCPAVKDQGLALLAKIGTLEAENETKTEESELDRLRAENAELREALVQSSGELTDKCAIIAELREALRIYGMR